MPCDVGAAVLHAVFNQCVLAQWEVVFLLDVPVQLYRVQLWNAPSSCCDVQ
jgi:hypothetical protein